MNRLVSGALLAFAWSMTTIADNDPAAAQTDSEKRRIQELLAPQGARWAKARRANPVVDGAIICPDLATVDLATDQAVAAAGDRTLSVLSQGKSERIQRAMPQPDLATLGCAFVPAGTPVLIEETNPVPLVQVEINGSPFRGVTHPAMVGR